MWVNHCKEFICLTNWNALSYHDVAVSPPTTAANYSSALLKYQQSSFHQVVKMVYLKLYFLQKPKKLQWHFLEE